MLLGAALDIILLAFAGLCAATPMFTGRAGAGASQTPARRTPAQTPRRGGVQTPRTQTAPDPASRSGANRPAPQTAEGGRRPNGFFTVMDDRITNAVTENPEGALAVLAGADLGLLAQLPDTREGNIRGLKIVNKWIATGLVTYIKRKRDGLPPTERERQLIITNHRILTQLGMLIIDRRLGQTDLPEDEVRRLVLASLQLVNAATDTTEISSPEDQLPANVLDIANAHIDLLVRLANDRSVPISVVLMTIHDCLSSIVLRSGVDIAEIDD
ncbi:MAG: hypothetical protein SGCHY_003723 [Lobulomycetales sp.]